MGLKASASQYWDNMESDPSRPRIAETISRISTKVARASWPKLELFYTHRLFQSSRGPKDPSRRFSQTHTLESSVRYAGERWKAGLVSKYSADRDKANGNKSSSALFHELRGSYRLWKSFRMKTALSVKDAKPSAGPKIRTPTASLTFGYEDPSKVLKIKALGSYSWAGESGGRKHWRKMKLASGVDWKLGDLLPGSTQLSLKFQYTNHLDYRNPNNSKGEFSGKISLTVASH
ncbi:MAG: hypothetical protein R3245_11905 [Kiloniellales bacterium]|nr:hypothetical protein [Kiloniellales bacterium]